MVGHGVEHHHHAQVLPLLGHCDTPCERYDRRPHSLPVEGAYREFARRREGMCFALDGGVWLHRHQFHLPAMCMIAGTSTMRIRVASSSTAAARPNPTSCTARTRAKAKVPNTRIMIAAALVMVEAVADSPSIVAWSLRPVSSNTSFTRVSRNTS